MAFHSESVTVTTMPQQLPVEDIGGRPGLSVGFKVIGAATVYVGGEDVTSVNGYPVATAEPFSATLESSNDAPWVVTASGTSEVRVIRAGGA